jgi:hypothetical protein
VNALEWVAARALDAHLAGDDIPGWMALVGLALFGVGAAVLAAMAVRARERRHAERGQPEPGNLLDADPWLADRTIEIPVTRPRPMRRTHRYPVARHVPTGPAQEWPTIVLPAADPDATVTVSRPRSRWGAR